MPRTTTPDMQTALQAGELCPAYFLQMTFISETLYLWTGLGNFTWGGHTYSGIGSLLGFSDDKGAGTVEEGYTVEARGLVITFSGLDANGLTELLSDYRIGQPVVVYFGLFTDSTRSTLIDTPVCVWAGQGDQPTPDFSGPTATISIACENVLNEMNVAVDRRRTYEDMQWQTPGDLGFQFIAALQQRTIYWGTVPSNRGANTP